MNNDQDKRGKLYLCATPIGNLEDITLRALDILRNVHRIAAENISHTRKLCARYDISSPLISYREANRDQAGQKIIDMMEEGLDIALVSDAGTPGISDPGYHLVALCISRGFEVVPVPGANAAIAALTVSGLPPRRFLFEGFLPRKKGPRRKMLMELAGERRTLIFYESPNRVNETLADMEDVLGDRRVVLARELTKKFEEVIRGTIPELKRQTGQEALKGEIVLVVEGCREQEAASIEEALDDIRNLLNNGRSFKDAVDIVAMSSPGISRRELYNAALKVYN